MICWVSPSAARAVVATDEAYLVITPGKRSRDAEYRASQVTALTRDWLDMYPAEVESVDEARRALRKASAMYEALLLTSLAIDRGISPERRAFAAIEAERYLHQDGVKEHVLGVYCSRVRPEGVDLVGTLQLCEEHGLHELAELVETLRRFEPNINAAVDAWLRTRARIPAAEGRRDAVQAMAVRSGLFLAMTKRIGSAVRRANFPRAAEAMLSATLLREYPELRDAIGIWSEEARSFDRPRTGPVTPFTSASHILTRTATVRRPGRGDPWAYTEVSQRTPAFA